MASEPGSGTPITSICIFCVVAWSPIGSDRSDPSRKSGLAFCIESRIQGRMIPSDLILFEGSGDDAF